MTKVQTKGVPMNAVAVDRHAIAWAVGGNGAAIGERHGSLVNEIYMADELREDYRGLRGR